MTLNISKKRLAVLIVELLIIVWLFFQLGQLINLNAHDNLDLNTRLIISMVFFARIYLLVNIKDNQIKDQNKNIIRGLFLIGFVLVTIPTTPIVNYIGLALYILISIVSLTWKYKGIIYILDKIETYRNANKAYSSVIMYYSAFLIFMIISIIAREYTVTYLLFLILLICFAGFLSYSYLNKCKVSDKQKYYLIAITVATSLFLIIQKYVDFNIIVCVGMIVLLSIIPIVKIKNDYFIDVELYNEERWPTVTLI
ncbi:hypothetical protein [Mycoplasma sp. P36-A1]|uniref:hypothetical protein n=1 Tax=Mycoplasma sp. P36-A1 TaxID=3252900 RepID=UPI003C2F6788